MWTAGIHGIINFTTKKKHGCNLHACKIQIEIFLKFGLAKPHTPFCFGMCFPFWNPYSSAISSVAEQIPNLNGHFHGTIIFTSEIFHCHVCFPEGKRDGFFSQSVDLVYPKHGQVHPTCGCSIGLYLNTSRFSQTESTELQIKPKKPTDPHF